MEFVSFDEWKRKKESNKNNSPASTSSSATGSSDRNAGFVTFDEWRAARPEIATPKKSAYTNAENWQREAQAVLRDYGNFAQNWSNDNLAYESYRKRMNDYVSQFDSVYSGLDGSFSGQESVSRTKNALDYALRNIDSVRDGWGAWGSQEEYDSSIQWQNDVENLNLGTAWDDVYRMEGERGALEAQINATARRNAIDSAVGIGQTEQKATPSDLSNMTYSEMLDMIDDDQQEDPRIAMLEDLDRQIAQRSAYLQSIERSRRLGEMTGAALSDADFENKAAYTDPFVDANPDKSHTESDIYFYINNPDKQDAIRNDVMHGGAFSLSIDELDVIDQMTDEERNLFNYYYNTGGASAAEEFFQSITPTIRQRRAAQAVEDLRGNYLRELGFLGSQGWESGVTGIGHFLDTESDYIEPSWKSYATAAVREDLGNARILRNNTGTSAGQIAGDVISSVGNMAPSIIASSLVGTINPAAGKIVGQAMFGASAAGNAYQEMLNAGYGKEYAKTYGAVVGASEVALSSILGGITQFGGALPNGITDALLKNVDKAVLRVAIKLAGNSVGEFTEEYLQEVLAPYFQNLILGTDNDVRLFSEDALYAGMLGAITAGLTESGSTISGAARTNNTGRAFLGSTATLDDLKLLARLMPDNAEVQDLASRVNEKSNAYTVGRFYEAVENGMPAQYRADVEASRSRVYNELVDAGVTTKDANAIANVAESLMLGKNISKAQETTLNRLREELPGVDEAISNGIHSREMVSAQLRSGVSDSVRGKFNTKRSTETATEATTADNRQSAPTTQTAPQTVSQVDRKATSSTVESIAEEYDVSPSAIYQVAEQSSKQVDEKAFAEGMRSVLAFTQETNLTRDKAAAALQKTGMVSALSPQQIALAVELGWDLRDVVASEKQRAYDMGIAGQDIGDVLDSKRLPHLTEEQRREAFNEGAKVAKEAKASGEKVLPKTASMAYHKGSVRFDGDAKAISSKFKLTQKSAYIILDRIAQLTGMDIVLFASKTDEYGNFIGVQGEFAQDNPNEIRIDVNAGLNNVNDMSSLANYVMLRTFTHEFVHSLEVNAKAEYRALKEAVFAEIRKNGKWNVEDLILAQQELGGKNEDGSYNLSYDDASHEVLAQALVDVLPQSTFIETLATQHRNIFDKLYAALKRFMRTIRHRFEQMTSAIPLEASALKRDVDGAMQYAQHIVDLFDKAALAAVETVQSRETAEETGGTDESKNPASETAIEGNTVTPPIDPKIVSYFKSKNNVMGKIAVFEYEGRSYVTDGALAIATTPEGVQYARENLGAGELDGRAAETAFAGANTLITQGPLEGKTENGAVYRFLVGEKKIFVNRRRFSFLDGGLLYANAERLGAIKSVDTNGEVIGYIMPLHMRKEPEDMQPAKTRSFSQKMRRIIDETASRKNENPTGKVRYQARPSAADPSKLDPRTVTRKDVEELLNKAYAGFYADKTVVPVRISTPGIVQERLKIKDLPMAMPVSKIKQAMREDNGPQKGANVRGHGFSASDLADIMEAMDSPRYVFSQPGGKGAVVVQFQKGKQNIAAIVEFGTNINQTYTNGYEGGEYNLTVTTFGIDGGDLGLLWYSMEREWDTVFDKKKEGDPAKKFQATRPFAIEQDTLNDNIPQPSPSVNTTRVQKKNTSLKRYQMRPESASIESDADYMEAVNNGDMETAQRMVDEAARAAGYNRKYYHGSRKGGGFTVFRDWQYFTENKEYAERYMDYAERYMDKEKPDSLYTVYVKSERMFDTRKAKDRRVYNKYRMEQGLGDLQSDGLPDWTDGYSLSDLIDEEDLPYDGIVLNEGGDVVDGRPVSRGISFVIRKSNQVKSADPVTYDDGGNVVPLSERFNPQNSDIRYQRRENLTDRSVLERIDEIVDAVSDSGTVTGNTHGLDVDEVTAFKGKLTAGERDLLNIFAERLAKLNDLQEQRREQGRLYRRFMADENPNNRDKDAAVATKNRMDILDQQIEKAMDSLREAERAKGYKSLLTKSRELVEQTERGRIKTALQLSREKRERSGQRRQRKESIIRSAEELESLLNKGNKKRNVKKDMQGLAAGVADLYNVLFNEEMNSPKYSKLFNERIVRNGFGVILSTKETTHAEEAKNILAKMERGRTQELENQLAYRMGQLHDALERERERINSINAGDVFQRIADEYKSLQTSGYDYIRGAFSEDAYNHLLQLKDKVGTTAARDMTLSQLIDLDNAYRVVLTTIRNANKLFIDGQKQTVQQAGNRVIVEVGRNARKNKALTNPGKVVATFTWNNEKPIYAFERIGSDTLTNLFWNIRNGEDVWIVDVEEAKAYRQAQAKKYGYDSWDAEKRYEFKSTDGATFSLTLEQLMSLYAYSKREQATEHLLKGGVVLAGAEVIVNGKRLVNDDATAYAIPADTLAKIGESLTADQRGYVDAMQDYLSREMARKGNEISMQLYGIELFGEKNYFPINSSGIYNEKAEQQFRQKENGQISIVNSGFTKSTAPKASNPVRLSGFSDVWASHVNEMSMYHAFVLPLEDFRKVRNFQTTTENGTKGDGVIAAIQNAQGSAAVKYINQLLEDLNGGTISDDRESGLKKLTSKFKKAATMASLSVVAQQISSLPRAWAMIDAKYFAGKVNKQKYSATLAEMRKYAPVMMIKEMGHFDTGMGRSATEYINAREYAGKERFGAFFKDSGYRDEILGKAPAKVDEIAWMSIWEACKKETHAKYPNMSVTSEAFLKAAGKRFTEVIVKTQVYDSTLTKSANMRSKSALMGMVTSFLAEPTVTANMFFNALRSKDSKAIARTVGALVVSAIANNLLSSIFYAMRDDDEDETFWEKYFQAFTTGMADSLNPLTWLPFLRDVWSILQGFDVQRADMNIISAVVDSVKNFVRSSASWSDDMTDEEKKAYWKEFGLSSANILLTVSNAFGIPLKNIYREGAAIFNTFEMANDEVHGNGRKMGEKIWDDIRASTPILGWFPKTESKTDRLYDAIVSGDAGYQERAQLTYSSEKSYKNAVRKALRENDPRIEAAARARMSGDLTEYVRLFREILNEGHFEFDTIMAAVNSAENALTPDKESTASESPQTLFTIGNYYTALVSGDETSAQLAYDELYQQKLAEGYLEDEARSSVESSLAAQIGQAYRDDEIGRDQALRLLTENTEGHGEYDIKKWDFQIKYGFSWGSRERAYRTGAINRDQLIEAYMDLEGVSRAEAVAYVDELDFESNEGFDYSDISAEQKAGNISMDEATQMYIQAGFAPEEAEEKAFTIDFIRRNPEAPDITYSAISNYTEHCEPVSISVSTYYDAWKFCSNIESDGTRGNVKNQYVEYITSLPISFAQQKALWLALKNTTWRDSGTPFA